MNGKHGGKLRLQLITVAAAALFAAAGGVTRLPGAFADSTPANASCASFNPAAQGWPISFAEDFHQLDISEGSGHRWQSQFVFGQRTLPTNHESELYVDPSFTGTGKTPLGLNPFAVHDGTLTITASEADPALRAKLGVSGARYLSGLLTTAQSFQQTYGYFEMRAKTPSGKGLWPAFWLLPPDGKWPPEIDVMEVLGHDPAKLYVSAHTAESGQHKGITKALKVPDTSAGFHTYGVLWTRQDLTWFFDGCRVAGLPTPADLHGPMYMLINLAVGGTWPGYPDRSTRFPAEFKVQQVRAFTLPENRSHEEGR